MYRAEILGNFVGKIEKAKYGRTRCGKENGQAWRSFDLVQKMLWLRTTENGTKTDELLQTGEGGTTEHGKLLKLILSVEAGRIPAKEARNWKIEGQKGRMTRKEYRRLWNQFETGGFRAQKGLWNVAREKMSQDRGALLKEEGDLVKE